MSKKPKNVERGHHVVIQSILASVVRGKSFSEPPWYTTQSVHHRFFGNGCGSIFNPRNENESGFSFNNRIQTNRALSRDHRIRLPVTDDVPSFNLLGSCINAWSFGPAYALWSAEPLLPSILMSPL